MMISMTIILVIGLMVLAFYRPRAALTLLPCLCGLLIFVGFLCESNFLVILALCSLLIVPIIVLPQGGKLQLGNNHLWILSILFFVVILLIFVMGILTLHGLNWGGVAFFFTILGGGAIIVYGVQLRGPTRQTVASQVFTTLGMSVELQLPLTTALDMSAQAYNHKTSRILQGINHWLLSGYTLSQAIHYGYPQCPPAALAAIQAAEPIHQLPQAMRSIRIDLDTLRKDSFSRPSGFIYPLVLLAVTFAIAGWIFIFVFPQFVSVFEEMVGDKEIAPSMQFMIDLWRNSHGFGELVLLLAIPFFLLGPPLFIYTRFHRRRPNRPHVFSDLCDIIKWWLPLVHWFEKTRSQQRTTEYLLQAIRAGANMSTALDEATRLDINACYRRRLKAWSRRVDAGDPLAIAAKRAHVGKSLVWAFQQEGTSGATPTTLGVLATFYRIQYRHRLRLAHSLVTPIGVLAVATLVAFITYGFYAPMVEIIHTFADIYP